MAVDSLNLPEWRVRQLLRGRPRLLATSKQLSEYQKQDGESAITAANRKAEAEARAKAAS